MEIIKIYISLKEAESLIFDRCLFLSKSRDQIRKAQGLLSVMLTLDKNKLQEFDDNYLIVFSAVSSFEIPEKDKNLFINHYKLPLGLLQFSSRNVRDISVSKNLFDENKTPEHNAKNYILLRNGFLGLYSYAYDNIQKLEIKKSVQCVFEEFNSLSEFKKKMLSEIFEHSKYPIFTIKVDRFVTDNFFRIIWWGKFIGDNLLSKLENNTSDEIADTKRWLKVFLEFDDLDKINSQLQTVPEELKSEIDFLLGYYFAAVNFESLQAEKSFKEKLNAKIKYENNEMLFCWISFFKSLFNEKINYLYFIKPLFYDIYEIEKKAFELGNNNFENIGGDTFNFEFKEIDPSILISDYFDLREGGKNHSPQLINFHDAKNVFLNNLSCESLKTNGFEFKSGYEKIRTIQNSCWFSENNFQLSLNSSVSTSDIIFFVDKSSKATAVLKSLKLKVKPNNKIIEKNKKVLLGFLKPNKTPNLCSFYSSFIDEEIVKQFEKIVFILLVDLDSEKIQSLEFDKYRKDQIIELNRMFNKKVELIVKNEKTNNDVEIKRNLKNVLQGYNSGNIEVIDENFENLHASWIIEANTDYLIKNENENYYSILNVE